MYVKIVAVALLNVMTIAGQSVVADAQLTSKQYCQNYLLQFGGALIPEKFITRPPESGHIIFTPITGYPKIVINMTTDTSDVSMGIMYPPPAHEPTYVVVYPTFVHPVTGEQHCVIEAKRNFEDGHTQPLRFADGTVSDEVR
jgi:hypothetical protein